MSLLDFFRTSKKAEKPLNVSRRAAPASRDAGSSRGALAGWRGPEQASEWQAAQERARSQRRAADLAANNWVAESALQNICQCAVGTGLTVSARIPADKLGLSREQAAEIGRAMEWEFWRWTRQADARGISSFEELQSLGLRTMLAQGEMLHIPAFLPEDERLQLGLPYSLVIQAVHPQRLRTPLAFQNDPSVRDGIRFSPSGRPISYFIAAPFASGPAGGQTLDASDPIADLASFRVIPARVGTRTGVFHLFNRQESEQVRGWSAFANSIGLFQQLGDSISYELLAQTMAAQFPIFISRDPENLTGMMPIGIEDDKAQEEPRYFEDLTGPQIMYGNPGEKPEVLKNERPSANFLHFVRTCLNAISASLGIPYIALARDFSDANYSVCRAAMNEAWRTYRWYRAFFARRYCQPVYEMLIEEAILRGTVVLPAGAPSFAEARDLWCSATWNGPARGYMDPQKEVQADILARDAHLKTMHDIFAENGRDFDDDFPTLLEEAEMLKKLSPATAPAPAQAMPAEEEPRD